MGRCFFYPTVAHGQSAAVFGLAYLLGIELMPRIRRWQKLTLYRSDNADRHSRINDLFAATVNSKGVDIRPADRSFLSPYTANKLKRFGEYLTDMKPDAMPTRTTL
ncbi:Tn3 family transposase [Rhodoferax antarcticus]|uniref:Transposase n=2 Tax=Rhodoferax antarcticus TaxID=81479 RepID=A0A1Q8YHX7_9BURK|nr:Tn3 family transposase [Rhodoferax antarcticus]APW45236.1 hypothetical protein RA876_01290 [Rhodoferax antarcticus]OLP07500.1 transposase [Rhodoferax antarcticus ANT.BR]